MKGVVQLKIWKGFDTSKPAFFNVNGWDYKVAVESIDNTDYIVVREIRTNTVIQQVLASEVGVYPGGNPLVLTLSSERPHPVFALENIPRTHQLVHTSWSPSPNNWVIEVYTYDTTATISIPIY